MIEFSEEELARMKKYFEVNQPYLDILDQMMDATWNHNWEKYDKLRAKLPKIITVEKVP